MSRRNRNHACMFCGNPVVKQGSDQARMVDVLRDSGEWWTARGIAQEAGCTVDQARRLVYRVGWNLERRRRWGGREGTYEYRWVGD